MKILRIMALLLLLMAITAGAQQRKTTSAATHAPAIVKPGERPEVLIETTMGNIRIQLYNETPQHRDNFLKLIREYHFYDSLLFHRVIPDFMIQAGDPSSKNAPKGARLGEQSLDYNIPAEIRLPQIFHKHGTLAAAREPDIVNPMHESSSSQFYIVIGKKQDDKGLERGRKNLQKLFGDSLTMTKEMEETYRTIGGTPHLDGAYTVFGEVTEGMDVVEKIPRGRQNHKGDNTEGHARTREKTGEADCQKAGKKKTVKNKQHNNDYLIHSEHDTKPCSKCLCEDLRSCINMKIIFFVLPFL